MMAHFPAKVPTVSWIQNIIRNKTMLRALNSNVSRIIQCRGFASITTTPARAIVAHNSLDGKSLNWKFEDINVSTTLGPHELLIDTKACGVCHTDLAFGTELPTPKVLGHEGAAIVRAIGSAVTTAKVGDPVLLSFNYCGDCSHCEESDPAYCEDFFGQNFVDKKPYFTDANGNVIDGRFFGQSTFSSVTVTTENSIVNAKDFNLSNEEFYKLSPLGCGVQTGAGATYIAAQTKIGQSVVVYGLGGVGFAAIMGARVAGASKIIAVDINEKKLAMAKDFGATHTIKAGNDEEVHAKIMEITGRGADVSFEGIGGAHFVEQAISNSAIRGKIIYVGVPKDPEDMIKVPLLPFLFKGGHLMSCIEGDSYPKQFVPQMVQWYKDGIFPADKMVQLYKAEDFQAALDDLKKGTVIKPVLTF